MVRGAGGCRSASTVTGQRERNEPLAAHLLEALCEEHEGLGQLGRRVERMGRDCGSSYVASQFPDCSGARQLGQLACGGETLKDLFHKAE